MTTDTPPAFRRPTRANGCVASGCPRTRNRWLLLCADHYRWSAQAEQWVASLLRTDIEKRKRPWEPRGQRKMELSRAG